MGEFPTGTVLITASLPVSITDTFALPWFTAYSFLPSAVSASATGVVPTGTIVINAFCVASITPTLLAPAFATYILDVWVVARNTGFEPLGRFSTVGAMLVR